MNRKRRDRNKKDKRKMESFYPRYREIRSSIRNVYHEVAQNLLMEFYFDVRVLEKAFMSIENIMDFSANFHDYFYRHNTSLLEQSYRILQNMVIVDDSPLEDLVLYFSAYLFNHVQENYSLYDDFVRNILELADYYATFIKATGKEREFIEMIQFQEMFENLSFS